MVIVLRHANRYGNSFYLIQNSPAVKKVCTPKKAIVKKRCEIQGGSQEMAEFVLIQPFLGKFVSDNSGEFVLPSPRFTMIWHPNSPELSLLKFLLLAYNQATSWPPFHIFFHNGLLGAAHFLQLGYFGLHFTSFVSIAR